MALSEDALVEQCRRGDSGAFEQLVARYEKKVFNLAYRLTGNRNDADDIAQEAFLKVYTSLREFRGEASFSTWLYRVVSNACLDELRKRSRRRAVSLDNPISPDDPSPRQTPSDRPEPGDSLERAEVRAAVQRGIASLSPDHKIVLVLRDIQGMPYETISEALRMPVGTVKSRLNRARSSLKQKLSETELFRDAGVRTGERGEGR